jgi:ankyrin repeat protein
VKLLLDSGADKDKANENGETPLYIAAQEGYVEIVKLLLDAGADKDKADEDDLTPLHIAAALGHSRIVMWLIEAGADKDKDNDNGETPLYIAAEVGHDRIIKLLLDSGANKNKADNNGLTPLYVAAQNGHDACVKVLLDSGADPNKANNRDRTPLHIASENGYVEIVKLLMEADKFNLNNIKKNADLINILYNSPDVFSDQQYNKIIKTYFKPMYPKTMCHGKDKDTITLEEITSTSSSPSKKKRLLVWARVPRNPKDSPDKIIYDCFALDTYLGLVLKNGNKHPYTRDPIANDKVRFYYIESNASASSSSSTTGGSRSRTKSGKRKSKRSQRRPPNAVCTRAQKLGIRLTVKRNNKRVYKSEEVLRTQIKNAINRQNRKK